MLYCDCARSRIHHPEKWDKTSARIVTVDLSGKLFQMIAADINLWPVSAQERYYIYPDYSGQRLIKPDSLPLHETEPVWGTPIIRIGHFSQPYHP